MQRQVGGARPSFTPAFIAMRTAMGGGVAFFQQKAMFSDSVHVDVVSRLSGEFLEPSMINSSWSTRTGVPGSLGVLLPGDLAPGS